MPTRSANNGLPRITNSHRSTADSARRRKSRRRHAADLLQLESLEDRRLLSATPNGALGDYGPMPLLSWLRVPHPERIATEIHYSPEGGSHEFVWEPLQDGIEHHAGHGHGHGDDGDDHGDSDGDGGPGSHDATDVPSADPVPVFVPISEVPVLNSNPGAPVDLFLDFDGHFQASWGSHTNALTPVYDIDGDETTFSETEIQRIQTAYQMVAEDFAPFNINVTTVEPATLAEGVADSVANGKALRVAIGGSWSDWYGSSSGGVAYVNNFTSSIANVVYVFTDNASSLFGDVVSHEAGHGFGLRHQSLYDDVGNLVEEYHPGNRSWQPIMGGGTSSLSLLGTWHNGPNINGPTSLQDDMAILAGSTNGFGYRTDDHADTAAGATPLQFDASYWTGSGNIETNNDVDVFTFNAPTGRIRFDIETAEVGGNLDAVARLFDHSGSLVAQASPADTTDATIISDLNAGQYSLHVTKVDNYGWLGTYSVTGYGVADGPFLESSSAEGFSYQSLDSIRLQFKDPINPASLTLDDIHLHGPAGEVALSSIIAVAGMNNTAFDILPVAPLSVAGVYDLSIDPVITDPLGNIINQDQDEIAGEAIDDRYVSRFWIAAPGRAELFASSTGSVYANELRTDAAGSIFVAGVLSSGSADVDPGPGTTTLTSAYLADAYLAKYTPNLDLVWATQFSSGDSNVFIRGLDFDALGNTYVVGYFGGTTTFGSISRTSQGSNDAFLAKLDPNGNVAWVRTWGGTAADVANAVAVTADNSIHVGGYFRDTVDLDPTGGTLTRTSVEASSDIFVSRFDSNGNFLANSVFQGPSSDILEEFYEDPQGNLIGVGTFSGTVEFGQNVLESPDSTSTFVLKLDPTYNVQWVRQASGPSSITVPEIAVDGQGSTILTGYFLDTVSFGPGTPTLTNTGERDSYVVKWDNAGNLLWTRQIDGGEATMRILDVDVDSQNNVFLSGYFEGIVDLDPGPGEVLRDAGTARDEYLLSLDAGGDFRWVHQMVDNSTALPRATTIDPAGNAIMAWDVVDTVTLPNGDVFTNTAGSRDFYLYQLPLAPGITVNPTSGLVTTEAGGTATFDVTLNTAPTANVSFTLTSSDAGEGVASSASITFTPLNWNVPQTVTVQGVNDTLLDGDVTYTIITGIASSADSGYDGFDPADVSVTNADDDQPIELFSDSFENGQWAGRWVEDSQNDWFTSTQRRISGSASAEVDGRATDATLTLANGLDLTSYGSVELSFHWLIESGFDGGEYLALDLFNGTWQNDIARLRGNVDQENTWHQVTIPLDASYLTSNFRLRFRSTVSGSTEDANVDDVRIVATSFAAPPNQAPVAVADAYSVGEDQTLTIAASGGLLNNDTDPDSDPLSALLSTPPTHGTVTLAADGSFSYTPNADYAGTDTFRYLASDGADASEAIVTVTVVPANDGPIAQSNSVATTEDTSVSVTLVANDVDGDVLSYEFSSPSSGTLSGTAPLLTYTPNENFFGSDSFTFTASDGSLSSSATITINVAPVNDPPTISSLANVTIAEDSDTGAIGFTIGDVESSADSLSVSITSSDTTLVPPTAIMMGGSAANRTLVIAPTADLFGTALITVSVTDGTATTETAFELTVTAVNDAPSADGQSLAVRQAGTLEGVFSGSDVDGDSLTFVATTPPANGTLTVNGTTWTYQPDSAFSGTDSFQYTASDGSLTSVPAVVEITVAPNEPPIADAQSLMIAEDSSAALTLTGSDANGDVLTFTIVDGPTNGVLSGTAPDVVYVPNANYFGSDSFTFVVSDGLANSNPATINVQVTPVNDPPTAAAGLAFSTNEDSSVAVILAGNDLDGDELTYELVSGPASGTLSGTAPNLTYTPASNFHGSDSFTFRAFDGTAYSTPATVALTVASVNDNPVANPDSYTVDQDQVLTVIGAGVLGNDTDIDGDSLNASILTSPTNGSMTLNANGSFTYSPAPGFFGTDSFTYTANDGNGGSATGTVSLTVNEAPDIASMHVGDLDGTVQNVWIWWRARVTVQIVDAAGSAVSGASVAAEWSGGFSRSVSATTNASGQITLTSGYMSSGSASTTLTVTNVTHPTLVYNAAANTDPDGDSSGTAITVFRNGSTAAAAPGFSGDGNDAEDDPELAVNADDDLVARIEWIDRVLARWSDRWTDDEV